MTRLEPYDLTPQARRRARAMLIAAGVLVVAGVTAGLVIPAALLVAVTPLLVYRVTGNSWSRALAWTAGSPPVSDRAARDRPRDEPARRRERAAARRPPHPVAAVTLIVLVVPAAFGIVAAAAGTVTNSDQATLGIGLTLTMTWTGVSALLARAGRPPGQPHAGRARRGLGDGHRRRARCRPAVRCVTGATRRGTS